MKNTAYKYLSFDKTVAHGLFENTEFPHEVVKNLSAYICRLGTELPNELFYSPQENVWIARNAKIAESAFINGPCIIDQFAEVRHCAYIRGSVIVGKNCVVGNSTELKNSILFDNVQVPHYNYVGDSILGYKAHLGASAVTSNVKSDKTEVTIRYQEGVISSGIKKFGAIIGDECEIGCGAILNPGTVIGNNTTVYPLCSVRGFVPPSSILKNNGVTVEKR